MTLYLLSSVITETTENGATLQVRMGNKRWSDQVRAPEILWTNPHCKAKLWLDTVRVKVEPRGLWWMFETNSL